jgi:hypothetical protein
MDLYMEYWRQAYTLDIQQEWVEGHQDKEIKWEDLHKLQNT